MEQPSQKSGTHKRAAPQPHEFDKLRSVRNLIGEEFPEKQAMAIVETVEDACSGFATQAGMEKMEVALRSDMEKMEVALRSDMERMEVTLRSDMERMEAALRSDLRSDMEKMELRIRADMEGMRADMEERYAKVQVELKGLYWYIPLVMGAVVGILKIT